MTCRAFSGSEMILYEKEHGLDFVPIFSLPEKGRPRSGHLTRSMAAKLLWAAWRLKEVQRDNVTTRQVGQHIARYILIGLYTGTRSSAIVGMRWAPNTTGGWFDLERGVMHRKPDGEAETRKRKPPAVIPDRLLAHLKRWKRLDSANGGVAQHVIRFNGNPVRNVIKGWHSARTKAKLPKWVIPHILRHTAITWSMQAGKNVNVVSEFYGVSVKVLETTYWHHHADYQKEMRR